MARHLWARWPSARPPPFFESVDDRDAIVHMLMETGAVLDDGMVYWDVRPSARFPTVEVRMADVPSTIAETVLLATLIRAAAAAAGRARSAERQLGDDRSRRLL